MSIRYHSYQAPPPNPEVVFVPEYWGSRHEFFPEPRLAAVPKAELTAGKSLMTHNALSALEGSLSGPMAVPGAVFAPTDDQIAAVSTHNFPGTLLMFDVESLQSLGRSSYERSAAEIEKHKEEFDVSARALMQLSMHRSGASTAIYPGRVRYSNGELVYRRVASLAYIARARKTGRQIADLHSCTYQRTAEGIKGAATLQLCVALTGGAVGETQFRNSKKNGFNRAYRIKSLEILAAGQPATVSEPKKFFSFLQRPSNAS